MARKGKGGRPDTKGMSKGEKFAFLANQRVTKALKAMSNLKRLANPRNYEFTEKQVDRLTTAITDATNETNEAFANALKGNANVATEVSFDVNAKA